MASGVWKADEDTRLFKSVEEGTTDELAEHICGLLLQFLQHCYMKRHQASSYNTEGKMAGASCERQYMDKFLELGFYYVTDRGVQKPQCVICYDVLSSESMKPTGVYSSKGLEDAIRTTGTAYFKILGWGSQERGSGFGTKPKVVSRPGHCLIEENIYGDNTPRVTLMGQFYARQQRHGEKIRQYALNLQELLQRVESNYPGTLLDKDKVLQDRFVEGLVSHALKTDLSKELRKNGRLKFLPNLR
ncbi:hypothetical protein BSL78_11442 [Apostichopus japonicus]|uniref:Uncharacterized protein n=1 Tax=Stichopus japonicus TaxID=307972 RepID=A0A2G8KUT3_STIJA|nr:hypothetical protein BSL78_11442 [Apostichopus japonicus]